MEDYPNKGPVRCDVGFEGQEMHLQHSPATESAGVDTGVVDHWEAR